MVFAHGAGAREPGFAAGPLLPLAAMQAARTVTVRLDDYFVRDADVALRVPYEEWLEQDAAMTANATPAVFGLLRPVLERHASRGRAAARDGDGRAGRAARATTPGRCGRRRTR